MRKLLFLFILLLSSTTWATPEFEACFTPQDNCIDLLVNQINSAKQSIYVQAYSFTSYAIAKALVRAEERGVSVNIIFDQSNFTPDQFSQAPYLIEHHIAAWNDNQVSIAHNKVMIFDKDTVETGSFNFTSAAQYHNAENIVIIHNQALAQQYLANWFHRQHVSKPIHTPY